MACRQHLRPKEFGLSHQTPNDFVRLEFGPPILYLIWSSFWGLYHFVWVCLEGYWWSLKSHYTTLDWFRQLSNVGYTVLTVFVLVDFSVALYSHCIKHRIATSDEEPETMQWYHKLTWVLFNISNSTATMVTITYWALLAKDSPLKGSTINKHGINFIFTILTIFLSRKPIKLHHVYMPMFFSFCYMTFTAIYFVATGIKVYPILDWSKTGKAIGLVVLYTIVCIPISHLLLFGLYRSKLYLKRRFGNTSDNSPQDRDANENNITENRTGESSTAQLLTLPSGDEESSLGNV